MLRAEDSESKQITVFPLEEPTRLGSGTDAEINKLQNKVITARQWQALGPVDTEVSGAQNNGPQEVSTPESPELYMAKGTLKM